MNPVRLLLLASGCSLCLSGASIAAPAKKPAAPPAKKPPATNTGGANQIKALEGDLVGREYVNGATRFKFEAPRVSYAWQGQGVEQGQVWVVIPFQASNATSSNQEVIIDQADLADAAAQVVQQVGAPETLTLLPAAHGKRELAWTVDAKFKPVKVVIQPRDGSALRLALPKGFGLSLPPTSGKVGEAISNGLVRFTLSAPAPQATFDDQEADEGQQFLVADWQLTSEFPDQREIILDSVQVLNADGEAIDPSSDLPASQLNPGGTKKGKVAFRVAKDFEPARVVVVVRGSAQPITITLK